MGLGYKAAPTSHREPPRGPVHTADPPADASPRHSPSPSSWSPLPVLVRSRRERTTHSAPRPPNPACPRRRRSQSRGPGCPQTGPAAPDCPPVSNPSAVTNLWGGRLGAGDSWEAGGVAWGLRRVSLGPRSPRCQSHCLWAQCCCGADAPPPTPCPGPCPTPLCPWPRIPQLRISPLLQFPEAT